MIKEMYYPRSSVFDLRQELSDLLYGDKDNPGIGQSVVIRRLFDRHCVCWDGLRGSPDPSCRYCDGEGFTFVETLNTAYLARNFGSVLNPATVISRQESVADYGLTDENRALGFCQYDVFPNYERYLRPDHPAFDKLYELKVDSTGLLIRPVIRTVKWKMLSVTPHRGDDGSISLFELGLQKENA
jgi:hypothetical protein